MKFALLFLAMLAVGAMGLAVQPSCPEFQILGTQLGDTPQMIQNALHYNKDNVMSGSPVGPYFNIGNRCSWRLNGAFYCELSLFADQAKLLPIGSATLSSASLSVTDQNGLHLVGGYMNFTSTITTLRLPNSGNPSAPGTLSLIRRSYQTSIDICMHACSRRELELPVAKQAGLLPAQGTVAPTASVHRQPHHRHPAGGLLH